MTRVHWGLLSDAKRDTVSQDYKDGKDLRELIENHQLAGNPRSIRRRIQERLKKQQRPSQRKRRCAKAEIRPHQPTVTVSYEGDEALIESNTEDLHSLEELLTFCNVDRDIWEVDHFVINRWSAARSNKRSKMEWHEGIATGYVQDDGGMVLQPVVQVKAWLKRRIPERIESAVAELKRDLLASAPARPALLRKKLTQPMLCEIAAFDLHLGKLAWGEETGKDYDSKIARDLLLAAVNDLLGHAARYEVEQFLFPIGQDFLHIDNDRSETALGTRVDSDSRFKKIFRDGRQLLVAVIDRLVSIAPVDVLVVPGNHDAASMFQLGDAIECYYHNDANVKVDNSAAVRKYYQYGQCMIAYSHGSEGKLDQLPLIMASESPEMWAATHWRHFKIGHLHHKKDMLQMTGEEYKGVRVSVMPSLSAADAWHYSKGFRATQAAEAFLWDKNAGQVATFSYNV